MLYSVTPLDTISSVSVSPTRDNIAVIHCKGDGRDIVLSVGGAGDGNHGIQLLYPTACHFNLLVIEFMVRLYIATRDADNKIEVNVEASPLSFSNTLKPGAVSSVCVFII